MRCLVLLCLGVVGGLLGVGGWGIGVWVWWVGCGWVPHPKPPTTQDRPPNRYITHPNTVIPKPPHPTTPPQTTLYGRSPKKPEPSPPQTTFSRRSLTSEEGGDWPGKQRCEVEVVEALLDGGDQVPEFRRCLRYLWPEQGQPNGGDVEALQVHGGLLRPGRVHATLAERNQKMEMSGSFGW